MRERTFWLGSAVLLMTAALAIPTIGAGAPPGAPADAVDSAPSAAPYEPEAAALGAEVCSACHEERVEAFRGNPHALLDLPDWSDSAGAGGGSCVSCHRGAADHIEQGGGEGTILAFAADEPPLLLTGVCQECHAGDHPRFPASSHAAAGMSCTSCHSIHEGEAPDLDDPPSLLRSTSVAGGWHGGPFDEIDGASATCAGCHRGTVDQFQLNEHHRLVEGVLGCTSCHDPHAPQPRLALGGFDLAGCGDCHADKTGPFVFEHGAAKVEGCVACHTPHGSVNRHMLTFQDMGQLCYSCHNLVPGFHVGNVADPRFGLDANCTNCHSAIHGSNFDPYFLK